MIKPLKSKPGKLPKPPLNVPGKYFKPPKPPPHVYTCIHTRMFIQPNVEEVGGRLQIFSLGGKRPMWDKRSFATLWIPCELEEFSAWVPKHLREEDLTWKKDNIHNSFIYIWQWEINSKIFRGREENSGAQSGAQSAGPNPATPGSSLGSCPGPLVSSGIPWPCAHGPGPMPRPMPGPSLALSLRRHLGPVPEPMLGLNPRTNPWPSPGPSQGPRARPNPKPMSRPSRGPARGPIQSPIWGPDRQSNFNFSSSGEKKTSDDNCIMINFSLPYIYIYIYIIIPNIYYTCIIIAMWMTWHMSCQLEVFHKRQYLRCVEARPRILEYIVLPRPFTVVYTTWSPICIVLGHGLGFARVLGLVIVVGVVLPCMVSFGIAVITVGAAPQDRARRSSTLGRGGRYVFLLDLLRSPGYPTQKQVIVDADNLKISLRRRW